MRHACNSMCEGSTHRAVVCFRRAEGNPPITVEIAQRDVDRDRPGKFRVIREVAEYTADAHLRWTTGAYGGQSLGDFPPTNAFLVEWVCA